VWLTLFASSVIDKFVALGNNFTDETENPHLLKIPLCPISFCCFETIGERAVKSRLPRARLWKLIFEVLTER
jgi:hypothetical protein